MKRNRPSLLQLVEEEWTCPITSQPLQDPVVTLDGHSYEKSYILQWFQKVKTSPKTGLQLNRTDLIPNLTLKSVIRKFQTEVKYEFQFLYNQLEQLQKINTTLQTRIKQLQQQNQNLKQQQKKVISLGDKLEASQEQQKKMTQEIIKLNQQLENIKSENQSLIKNIIDLTEERQKLQMNKGIDKIAFEDGQKKQQPKKSQKSFLPSNDYLMNLPVLYEEETKSLNHSQCLIDVEFFLMHDWSHIHILNLTNSGVDDAGFQFIANHISELENLRGLSLCQNQITKVKAESLQKMKQLKKLMFSHEGKPLNPLSDESKKVLEKFSKQHPEMNIEYRGQQKKGQ